MGDSAGAKEDFEKSLDLVPDYVQSLVKIASVYTEMGMSNLCRASERVLTEYQWIHLLLVGHIGDAAGAFGDFEAAIRHNPNDPDIYYHRGQRTFALSQQASETSANSLTSFR